LAQLLRAHYGRDSSVEVARALANVGSVMVKAGHVQDAFAVFKKAIAAFTKDGGDNHFEMVLLFRFIGDACVKEKEFSNALGSYVTPLPSLCFCNTLSSYQEGFDTLKKADALQSSIPLEAARLHLGTSACALGMGKLDDALAACEHAAALVTATQGGKLTGDIAFDILWQRAKIMSERHQAPSPADTADAAIHRRVG
jgi:tetratricopeptide (TPR) repeat protein